MSTVVRGLLGYRGVPAIGGPQDGQRVWMRLGNTPQAMFYAHGRCHWLACSAQISAEYESHRVAGVHCYYRGDAPAGEI